MASMSVDLVNKAPPGTKLWLLNCGFLEAEEGWFKRGGGVSTKSDPKKAPERRKMVVISVLIEHPTEGLILFETGSGKDFPNVWGAPLNDIFAQVDYNEEQELDKQIELAGHSIKDVKMVIMGHLHLDHAGGLQYFIGTDVPIYVHELELKHAFFCIANKSDLGVYLPSYVISPWNPPVQFETVSRNCQGVLQRYEIDLEGNLRVKHKISRLPGMTFDLNWKAFSGSFLEICPGINMHHSPGHTPGLCIMQVNLEKSGTWIFTTDQYHVQENYYDNVPQGWLARDHDDWVRSSQMIHMLQKRTNAKMIFGHCWDTLQKYAQSPYYHD